MALKVNPHRVVSKKYRPSPTFLSASTSNCCYKLKKEQAQKNSLVHQLVNGLADRAVTWHSLGASTNKSIEKVLAALVGVLLLGEQQTTFWRPSSVTVFRVLNSQTVVITKNVLLNLHIKFNATPDPLIRLGRPRTVGSRTRFSRFGSSHFVSLGGHAFTIQQSLILHSYQASRDWSMSNMRDFGQTYRFGSGHGEKKKLKKIYKYFQPIRMRYAICIYIYVCMCNKGY